jgi:hypothetical protein
LDKQLISECDGSQDKTINHRQKADFRLRFGRFGCYNRRRCAKLCIPFNGKYVLILTSKSNLSHKMKTELVFSSILFLAEAPAGLDYPGANSLLILKCGSPSSISP